MAVLALAQQLGVTRLARLTGLDRSGIEVAAAVRPLGFVLQVCNGKGRTFAAAARAALGEAAELWAAERVAPEELSYGTPGGLRRRHGAAAIWDGDLGSAGARHLPAELWHDDVFAAFRPGEELLSGQRVWIPAAAVHCPPPGAAPLGPLGWRWTSNGMGAHPRRGAALLHALLEAIERDQLARALPQGWTEPSLRWRGLRSTSVPPVLQGLQRRLDRRGLSLSLYDLTPPRGLGVPVAGALLLDREAGPVPLAAGYACRLSASAALEAAALEAAQSRLTDIHGAREDVEPMAVGVVEELSALLRENRPVREFAAMPTPPPRAGFDWLIGQLRRRGVRRLAAVDLAPPGFELSILKVVAPSFRVSELL